MPRRLWSGVGGVNHSQLEQQQRRALVRSAHSHVEGTMRRGGNTGEFAPSRPPMRHDRAELACLSGGVLSGLAVSGRSLGWSEGSDFPP